MFYQYPPPMIILFVSISFTIAEYGDLRISGGGSSGRLEIQDRSGRWGTICDSGFDDNAGDVACSQLGYDRSSDVYTDRSFDRTTLRIEVCGTYCDGNEDELIECSLDTSCRFTGCTHNDDIGIECTNSLGVGAIIGIVVGVVFFILVIISLFVICLCLCIPGCPCYCGGAQHRQQRFGQHSSQPQHVATTAMHCSSAQEQKQLQPMSATTDQPPYNEVPYVQAPLEEPPPYVLHEQQPYPPQPAF